MEIRSSQLLGYRNAATSDENFPGKDGSNDAPELGIYGCVVNSLVRGGISSQKAW